MSNFFTTLHFLLVPSFNLSFFFHLSEGNCLFWVLHSPNCDDATAPCLGVICESLPEVVRGQGFCASCASHRGTRVSCKNASEARRQAGCVDPSNDGLGLLSEKRHSC